MASAELAKWRSPLGEGTTSMVLKTEPTAETENAYGSVYGWLLDNSACRLLHVNRSALTKNSEESSVRYRMRQTPFDSPEMTSS